MKQAHWIVLLGGTMALLISNLAEAYTLPEVSAQSKACIECHKETTPIIYEQWGDSKHFRANVSCYECHKAEADDPDVLNHYRDRQPQGLCEVPRDRSKTVL